MKLVDLTQPFSPSLNDTAGSTETAVEIRQLKAVETTGVNAMQFVLGGHAGTHVDAPLHVVPGGATIAEVPLSSLYGPAVILDVRRDDSEPITPRDIESAAIEPGDIVFLETGWARFAGTPAYRETHPYLTVEAAEVLVRREARAVGIDASSLDMPRAIRPAGFHHDTLATLLAAGLPVVHGLANLERIRGRRCTVAAFPIVCEGADAGPARVVAILPEDEEESDA